MPGWRSRLLCCVSCVCAAFLLCPGMSLPSIHGAASLWCHRGFISAACPHAFASPPLAPMWPCSHGEGAAKHSHVSCSWERGHSSWAPDALAGKGPAPLGCATCPRAPAEALARGGLLPAGGRAAGGLVPAAQGCSCLLGTMTALLGIALGASQTSGVTLNCGGWAVLCSCVCPLEGAVGPFLCHSKTVPEAVVGTQHRDGHAASLGMASNQE